MYGVPDNLPVNAFLGNEFNQICLGRFQVQFHASGVGSISVEGRWELRDGTDNVVDSQEEHSHVKTFVCTTLSMCRLFALVSIRLDRSRYSLKTDGR